MKKKQVSVSPWFYAIVVTVCFLLPGIVYGGVKMPSFVLDSALDDSVVKSDNFSGNVLLITFFATWCSPCVQEVPNFVKLQSEYKDQGFSVVAISVDQADSGGIASFAEKKGINYPVLMFSQSVLEDFGGVYGIPASFMVNRKGEVVKRYTGYVAHAILAKDIKTLL